MILAIEPIPELANALAIRVAKLGIHNIRVKQVDCDLISGSFPLHVSDAFCKGTSSLLTFSDPSSLNDYWIEWPDSIHTDTIQVRCLTLREIIDEVVSEEIKIELDRFQIDFLKLDAQGKDYACLLMTGESNPNFLTARRGTLINTKKL